MFYYSGKYHNLNLGFTHFIINVHLNDKNALLIQTIININNIKKLRL